ncbi:biotin/lipoyl-containing protein [Natronospira sp.]|uniref:biotin/lipoyl-containing protein n=1 Tax=Natronospira sp. TaxID=2024970 RepID=UPI0038737F1F
MSKFKYLINGNEYEVTIDSFTGSVATLTVNGVTYEVEVQREKRTPTRIERPVVVTGAGPQITRTKPQSTAGAVNSPLPGVIKEIKVKEGEEVKQGACVIILEAMKMDNEIYAGDDGVVLKVHVQPGQQVLEGETLVTVGAP